jgi:hypothetical protein
MERSDTSENTFMRINQISLHQALNLYLSL